MNRFRPRRIDPALVVSAIALIVALGGTSYAALILPANSVGPKQLRKGAVTSAKLKNGAVIAGKIQNGAVIAGKIQNGAVRTAALQNAAVIAGKIQNGAVIAGKIQNGAVNKDKILNGAVDAAKIQLGAVTASKIQDGAVGLAKIQDGAISPLKIQDGAITAPKLHEDAVTASSIAPDAVTASSIAPDAVSAASIAPGSLTATDFAAGTLPQIAALTGNQTFGISSSSAWQWYGNQVTVTTNADQRLTGSAVASLYQSGGTPPAAPGLNVYTALCYQPSAGGLLTHMGNAQPTHLTTTYEQSSAASATVVPGAGTWKVGYCVLNNNSAYSAVIAGVLDGLSGWIQVTNS